jgi:hypothetical protein
VSPQNGAVKWGTRSTVIPLVVRPDHAFTELPDWRLGGTGMSETVLARSPLNRVRRRCRLRFVCSGDLILNTKVQVVRKGLFSQPAPMNDGRN